MGMIRQSRIRLGGDIESAFRRCIGGVGTHRTASSRKVPPAELRHVPLSFIRYLGLSFCVLGTAWLLGACMPSPQTTTAQPGQADPPMGQVEMEAVATGGAVKLKAVATTSIVADVVRQIAADRIELTVLLPVGVDPHTFEPTPQDVVAVADARIVFASGAGLEEFLDELIENAGGDAQIIALSDGLELRALEAGRPSAENGREGEGRAHPKTADPHTWFAPSNVKAWADRVEKALNDLDPAGSAFYRANAQSYRVALDELDAWIVERVSQIPAGNRKLMSDHAVLGYFTDRYGFQQIGAVFPGFSSASEPSAQELAGLEDAVRQYQVNAIFVGTTINPRLSQRIADETGIQLVTLYTGSLSEPGGEADTYIGLMRYNVEAIVEALKRPAGEEDRPRG